MPKSANAAIVDGVVTHSVNLLRVGASQRKAVLAMLESLEGELLGAIQKGGQTAFTSGRMKALLAQTQATIANTYQQISDSHGKALSKIAAVEAHKTTNILNASIGVPIATVGQSPEQLAAIAGKVLVQGRHPAEWWGDQDAQLQARFSAAMRMGMLQGEGVEKLVQRVRGTKAREYADGLMAISKAQATALVRTSVITAANEARIATITANPDVVKGIQWVATLDNRTTPICRALDGLQWSLPDFKPVGHDKAFPGPTAHWQCRSTQAPVTRSWKELAGLKGEDETAKLDDALQSKMADAGMDPEKAAKLMADTRASMDGQVAGKLVFDDWLKTKAEDFQDKLLGPGRAALWRDGKVTLAEMTDQDSRPLTIAQLVELVAKNADVPAVAEGENGLTLAERKLLQTSMAYGVQQNDVMTHWTDEAGVAVTTTGTTLTPDQLEKVAAMKGLVVLQNSLQPGEVWGESQLQMFGKIEGFKGAKIVAPTGRVSSINVKAGQVFTHADAQDVWGKYKGAANAKLSAQQKFQNATAANGKLKFQRGETDSVKLPPKTFNQVFAPAPTAPAVFHDPVAAAKAAEAEAAKLAAEQAAADQAKKAAAEAEQKSADRLAVIQETATKAHMDAIAARQAAVEANAAKDAAEAAAKAAQAALDAKNTEAAHEIAGILSDPKAKAGLAKALAAVMKAEPGAMPHELLEKAKAQALIDKTKATQAAALSAYKKNYLAGKPGTPAQLKALEALEPSAKAEFLAKLKAAADAAELKAAQEAAAMAAKQAAEQAAAADALAANNPVPAAPLIAGARPMVAPIGFPDDAENLRVIKQLGGSTGAELVEDSKGNRFVRKRGANAEHLREEVLADAIYRELGVRVPEARLYDGPRGPVKLARFQEGKTLAEYLQGATAAQRAAVFDKLSEHFAADALLGNWDVLGLNLDNVLVDAGGQVWRIDNGGSLRFRAMGAKKLASDWTEHTAELWTMRGVYNTPKLAELAQAIPQSVQAQFREAFGRRSIYDVARQIEKLDADAFAVAPLDIRAMLEKRLGHLRAMATRALDFEHSKWSAEFSDLMLRNSMELRERGIVGRMVPALSGASEYLKDANGNLFDELRSKRGAGSAGGPAVTPQDPWAQKFLDAIISINAHYKKQGGTFGNMAKVNEVINLTATLEHISTSSVNPALSKVAEHYLPWLQKIKQAQADFETGLLPPVTPGKDLLPKFDTGAGAKIYMAEASPAAVAAPRPGGSITQDVSGYISSVGGNAAAVNAWMSDQAGHSWRPNVLAMKYFVATSKTTADAGLFWGDAGFSGAKLAFQQLAGTIGGEDKLRKTFAAWIAYTQEILTNTAMPNKDDAMRVVRLIRTENFEVLKLNKIQIGNYGGEYVIQKGANESHSIMKITRVHGKEVTVQAVPYADITGVYLTDRPGQAGAAGSAQAAFLGDGENEFTANSSNIPFIYAGNVDLGAYAPEWGARLAAGHNAGTDATKWHVPLTHIRK